MPLEDGIGSDRPLSPKALDVLIVLVESRGRIVEKSDLMRQVWPDTFVEDNNLAFNVSVLRKLFGESGTSPRYIETVPKRGYRFVAEVREVTAERAEPISAPIPTVQIENTIRASSRRRFWRLRLVS